MTEIVLDVTDYAAHIYEIIDGKRTVMVGCTIGDNQNRSTYFAGYALTVDYFCIWVRIPNNGDNAWCYSIHFRGSQVLKQN